jgi:putative transposase
LIVPDVALHVIQRGHNRQACFLDHNDYLVYLACLRDLSLKADCIVHAYCLMTNHVHLLLTPRHASSCALLMKEMGQRYVQYFNRRYGKCGTLWEGRFRSCLAESARYVLACYRYVELNPVRAGMVAHPSAYLWSSYAANAGGRIDPLVSPHAEFLALGSDINLQRAAYRRLLDEAVDAATLAAIREATHGGHPLGSDRFKSEVVLPIGRNLERLRPGRRKSGSDPDSFGSSGKSGSDPDLFSAGEVS